MKQKVILTHKYRDEGIEELKENFNLIIVEGSGRSLMETLKEHSDAVALISFLSDPIKKEHMDALPNLKIIANYAVGYNNIDVAYAKSKNILVTNTPDILTDASADLTFTLILAACRRIVEADAYVRAGKFTGWGANLLLGKELRGATLGIIGMGRIGTAVAIRALGFGMNVIYYNRSRKEHLEKQYGFKYVTFDQLVREADVVSPHIPGSPEVHHLFNKETFDKMKPDAVFINLARGGIMDEAALADKLEKKELFAAGLDVYELEPKVHEKLMKLDNVVMAPHIGSATFTARLGMAKMTIANIKQTLAGQTPQNLVPECR